MENNRKKRALEILKLQGIHKTEYLGAGHEGVVFTDLKHVYKVILPLEDKSFNSEKIFRGKSFFINLSLGLKHLYAIELIKADEAFVMKYPYEKSENCTNYTEEEAISMLTELWQQKIVILDCKPENCIRVNNETKFVDLEGAAYNDNLFLNMCARMYLYANFYDTYEYGQFQKLKRSAINNFELPELKDLRVFVNRVYSNIVFEESKHVDHFVRPNNLEILEDICLDDNLEQLFFSKIKENKYLKDVYFDSIQLNEHNYFEPQKLRVAYQKLTALNKKVTLLIKTCSQDLETIEANVKHIVKQLTSPNSFYEIVVSIDTREDDFLRQYNKKGDLGKLVTKVKKLVEQLVVDRYVVFDEKQTLAINKQWFGIESTETHTSSKAPLAPQLYAFNECKGDYILQVDSDVLIGRKDDSHSFLSDMLLELEKNEDVLSVGFNIYNKENNEYSGFKNGGFVPEVRMGMIDKHRLYTVLPLPNSMDEKGKLELTWHRSLLKRQKEIHKVSIRGGDQRSFYIHPQNYRKKESYAWMSILDKVEQNILPDLQFGKFDVEGSLYDWAIPKRNEKIIVVSCFRNVALDRFLRMWTSLIAQNNKDFGVILLDDNSDNGLPFFIDLLIKPYKDKVTLIKNRNSSTRMENVYRAIHYYISNPEAIIVMLDGDDALIGNNVLETIKNKYEAYNADVVVGRFHQTYRIQPHYRYPVDFTNPRKTGGNVWQHLKTFKKYLFDSIPLPYFKHEDKSIKLYKNKWMTTCDDFAFMVPIIEMSEQPIQLDLVNYYYEREYEKRNDHRELKEFCIADVLNKKPLSAKNVYKGRKTFLPNRKKVEIDITYECNLKCLGCNRSCTQAPTTESVDLLDIEKFIVESIESQHQWELINILGGEPTLHPDFKEIIRLLHNEYILIYSPKTILQIVSNGFEEKSRLLCEEMRSEYKNVRIDYGSYKTDKVIEYFSPFNDAPVDDENFKNADFKKGCWVTSYCGIGLNKNGYYACAVAGGIDRITNKGMAISKLKDITKEKMEDQLNEFCKLCGNFKAYENNSGDFIPRIEKEPFKNVVTRSWKKTYKENKS